MKTYFRDRNGVTHAPRERGLVPDHPWTAMGCDQALAFVPGKRVHIQNIKELLCARVDGGMLTCIGCLAWELAQ